MTKLLLHAAAQEAVPLADECPGRVLPPDSVCLVFTDSGCTKGITSESHQVAWLHSLLHGC